MEIDFEELYRSVFNDSKGLEILSQVESQFIKNYMKTQAQKNDGQKNNPNKRRT
jgi:hypothetical protein